MKSSKLTSIFILFITAHLNLVMPVSKASANSDICIMNNTIHMAHHSDHHKIHNHDIDTHHSGHRSILHEIKTACNMDMSSSDIYFPGGEHPFTNLETQELYFYSNDSEAFSSAQAQIIKGFIIPLYNPPRLIS